MHRRRALLVASVVLSLLAASPAWARESVKYYVVADSYRGQPEYLAEIAVRFLADPARAQEIMDLNAGREQPDGGRLTDPDRLRPGWILVLPWDAHGEGVHYGPLPTAAPPAPPAPTAPPAGGAITAGCGQAGTAPDNDEDGWGALRVGADRAWPLSTGEGVLVAVADSGVDANLAAFGDRVAGGADIVAGSGRGDTDCLGSGTALASIVAAGTQAGSGVPGVAPQAGVLPVRMVGGGGPTARVADQVAAIDYSVATGARVLLLGGAATPAEPAVAAAIAAAVANDVVVVLPAGDLPATVDGWSGVLRVAPVSIDGSLHGAYPPRSVDVVAPGVSVAGLGISGAGAVELTGAPYAAAYAAGVVALVRARFPALDAAQVVHRMLVTAAPVAGTTADGPFGAGMVDPALAVSRVLVEETPAAVLPEVPVPAAPHPLRFEALALIAMLGLGTAVTLVLRLRRVIRPPDDPPLAAVQPGPAGSDRAGVVSAAAAPARAGRERPRLDLGGMAAPSLDPAGAPVAGDGHRRGAGRRAPAGIVGPDPSRTRAIHSGQGDG